MATSIAQDAYDIQSITSSPTLGNSPTFDKSFDGTEGDTSSNLLLITMLHLLSRIEAQLEGQNSRLRSVESSFSLRSTPPSIPTPQTSWSPTAPKELLWGKVVSEYEQSILKLRKQYVNDTPSIRGDSEMSRPGNCDEDAYSVSVYSGNILDQALEQNRNSEPRTAKGSSANENIPSIRYETDTVEQSHMPTDFETSPWEISSGAQSSGNFQRSQQHLDAIIEGLEHWKDIAISKIKALKRDVKYHIDQKTKFSSSEDSESRRPSRRQILEVASHILDAWRIAMVATFKNVEGKIKKSESRRLEGLRQQGSHGWDALISQMKRASFKNTKMRLCSFGSGFVAY